MKKGKFYFLFLPCFIFFLQTRAQESSRTNSSKTSFSVSGKVTDENDKPLQGITVQVKGTAVSTLTGADGTFKIAVPDTKSTLIFSYVGYLTKEVPVSNRMVINTSMELNNKSLTDVVVIGYGTQKQRNVTGAIAS